MEKFDVISRPAHYAEGREYEPIDVIEDWELGYHLACALKYIARAGRKDDLAKDLKKAVWYIERFIEKEEASKATYAELKADYNEVVDFLAEEANDWEFPHGLDDVVYYNSAEAGALDLSVTTQGAITGASNDDWLAFWDSDDDYMWDPSLGPVELTDKEIQDILDRKDLAQFDNNEIVSTVEKRGFIIGVKADGTTCELGGNGRCI